MEAIKAEAVAELAAFQNGLPVIEVRPQSLKKTLGCAPDQKWRDRARQMFNKNDAHDFWTKGLDGAISAAYNGGGHTARNRRARLVTPVNQAVTRLREHNARYRIVLENDFLEKVRAHRRAPLPNPIPFLSSRLV
ncbi:MAG: hypothetical protein WDM80_07580 [Limisphaerales bacterium]